LCSNCLLRRRENENENGPWSLDLAPWGIIPSPLKGAQIPCIVNAARHRQVQASSYPLTIAMATSKDDRAEPFPSITEEPGFQRSTQSRRKSSTTTVNRPAASSSLSGRLRRASQSFNESGPPAGFSAATGNIASSIIVGQRTPSYSSGNAVVPPATPAANDPTMAAAPVTQEKDRTLMTNQPSASTSNDAGMPSAAAPYANGYHFPPSKSFGQSTKEGLKAFWNYFTTPLGFLVVIYGLNVVAWGGMLFLLLCNAGKFSSRHL
jgi:hypothetical protein